MKIEIAKIRPNPNNPRHVITQAMIDELAASLTEAGQKTAVKVAILTEEEKAALNTPSSRPSPAGGEGVLTAQASQYEYEMVDGMLRLMTAQKQGWTEIEAEVKELDPKERFKESVIGNRGQGFFWLDLYNRTTLTV